MTMIDTVTYQNLIVGKDYTLKGQLLDVESKEVIITAETTFTPSSPGGSIDNPRIIYTTNAVESVHSSFRKVTKKGAFPNENALLKLLYLRTQELQTKWNGGTIRNWSMVLNQLMINDKFKDRIEKYQRF